MLTATAPLSACLRDRARWLGYAGLLPFCGGIALALLPAHSTLGLQAVIAYGAVILTFVGAIHWGRGLDRVSPRLLSASVLPSLVAWLSLLLPPLLALPVQVGGFLSLLLFDYANYRRGHWFLRLRTRLTLAVVTLLTLAWALALVRQP